MVLGLSAKSEFFSVNNDTEVETIQMSRQRLKQNFSWECGFWKALHHSVFKFSLNIHSRNREKFTVDIKMSCLHQSFFKVACFGEDGWWDILIIALCRQHTNSLPWKEKAVTQSRRPMGTNMLELLLLIRCSYLFLCFRLRIGILYSWLSCTLVFSLLLCTVT